MQKINLKKFFKLLIILNAIVSFCITWNIFVIKKYNLFDINLTIAIIVLYAGMWYFSLYRLYNLSVFGRIFYTYLVAIGFLFNILSNFGELGKIYYILSLFEHLIIGSIITFAHFTKIKTYFK